MKSEPLDSKYREIFLEPIRKCFEYRPAFGQGSSSGLSLSDFEELYGQDSFYSWLGLDQPMVYAAHKAEGGLTSVYRQIGIGSERLFRSIIRDELLLDERQLDWSYEYSKPTGAPGIHTLDAKIQSSDLSGASHNRFTSWLAEAGKAVANQSEEPSMQLGVIFEVRQGYKSADSKRQNADLRFGVRAYQAGYLPAFAIMSTQVSEPILLRYRNDGMLVLTGELSNDPTISTFAFFNQVVGFDLVAFMQRNTSEFKNEIGAVIGKLLSA
jgi:hypothetical protein